MRSHIAVCLVVGWLQFILKFLFGLKCFNLNSGHLESITASQPQYQQLEKTPALHESMGGTNLCEQQGMTNDCFNYSVVKLFLQFNHCHAEKETN